MPKWPDHLVDSSRLYTFLTDHLGISGQSVTTRKHHLAFSMERAVERARQSGQIRRYTVKDPASGDVVGQGYNRDELVQFLSRNRASIEREDQA